MSGQCGQCSAHSTTPSDAFTAGHQLSEWSVWSVLGKQYNTIRRLHSWSSAVLTLTGALIVAVFVIVVFYCKVHGVYRTVCRQQRANSDDSQLQYVTIYYTLSTRIHCYLRLALDVYSELFVLGCSELVVDDGNNINKSSTVPSRLLSSVSSLLHAAAEAAGLSQDDTHERCTSRLDLVDTDASTRARPAPARHTTSRTSRQHGSRSVTSLSRDTPMHCVDA